MSTNKSPQMKTYSRKPISRPSSHFDALISSATSSTKTSAAAVSVSRWGQTSFTSVRRQKELENNSNNSNSDRSFQDFKRPKIEKLEVLREKPIDTKTFIKPKVNKFFKSRTNAITDDIVKDKNKDKVENRLLTNNNSNNNNNNYINEKNEIEVKPKSYKPFIESQTKNIERKVNYHKSEDKNDKSSVLTISANEKKSNNKNNNNNNNNNYSVKRNSSQNVVAIRGTRSSRRLQGVEPEVVHKSDVEKSVQSETISTCIDICEALETPNYEMNEENDPIIDSNVSPQVSTDIALETTEDNICDNALKDEAIPSSQSLQQNVDIDLPNECLSSQSSNDDLNPIESKSLSQPILESSNRSIENNTIDDDIDEKRLSVSQPESTTTCTSLQPIVTKPKKKIFSSSKKNKAVFNMKNFWNSDSKDFCDEHQSQASEESAAFASTATDNKKSSNDFDFDDDSNYVKLHRVKKAHQCHDLGETEQFDDDIKYHLSGIEASNTISMRCLSILGLSQQAMRPEFRMHLRAHDDMPRIISALMDAPSDANLALCTATLMFVYSQDRLTMDIDPNALSLMLQLLETRSDECNRVETKHRNKVKDLCQEMKNKGHAKYLNLNEITAGKLAMETLLSLTSKRAGDWFKEELRRIKGIDFILDTVIRCAEFDKDEGFMIKIDRCMHVLENVSFNNIENQVYILEYKEGLLTSTCIKLLHSCKYQIILSNDSKVFLSAFFSILRVLTHLTSESADGCLIIGTYDGILDLLLESVFELPSFIMSDQRFDLMVILLCLCINLVEFCPQIRDLVVNSDSKLNRLIELLFKRIEEAQRTEQQTDELLESHESVQMTEAMQDNLLKQMLSQSGNHMEHSIIAACISLLLGCCIQDNSLYNHIVRDNLPNSSFDPLVEVLQKLRDFAYLAEVMTKKGKDRVDRIIQVFKSKSS